MNRVLVIVRNPAHIEELEPEGEAVDQDEVEPANLAPLISGNAPIITIPALEDEDVAEEIVEDKDENHDDDDLSKTMQDVLEELEELDREVIQGLQGLNQELGSILSLREASSQQHTVVPNVHIWDTGKAVEQEYRLYPNPTRKGLKDRLDNQVWDLLRIIQERVDQGTCNNTDMRLVDRLNAISVMHARLGVLTEIALKHRARRPQEYQGI